MTEIQYTHLEAVLLDYGHQITEEYRRQLDAEKKNASFALSNTVRPLLKKDGDNYTLALALQHYWKYLEYGTRTAVGHAQGKFPPVAVFEEWIRVKPVIPYRGKDGKIPTPHQLAFLIARKIWREGTRPWYFLTQAMPDEGEVMNRLAEAIRLDIEEWIRSLI